MKVLIMTKIDDLHRMEDLTEGLSTKADKMRVLERHGYARADIARFLGVRYQQVRNTLEGDKRTGYNPEINPSIPNQEASAFPIFRQLLVDKDGFVNVPPDMLEQFSDGEVQLFALDVKDGIFISSAAGMAIRVKASFA
jgi:predicted transcriptional regulator